MTVQRLYDILGNFPPDWEVRVSEIGEDYCTEIYDVKEMTCPKFNEFGDIIGEEGIGELELLTK